MITIALDESGEFEGTPHGDYSLIGGLVFQAQSEQQRDAEKRRIIRWLSQICGENGFVFPQALHGYRSGNSGRQRAEERILQNLHSFLAGKVGGPCNGSYSVFAVAGDHSFTPNCFRGSSNLLDDNVASNRYEHMASSVLNDLLFYTPALQRDPSFDLDLSTRALPENVLASPSEFLQSGHASWTGRRGTYVSVMDAGSYRGMLSTLIQNAKRQDLNFDLSVVRINYDATDENEQNELGFLYLADLVCLQSYRYLQRQNPATLGAGLEGIQLGWRELPCLLWAYHDIDRQFRNASDYLAEDDYFSCLREIFRARTCRDPALVRHYNKYWFDPLEQRVREDDKLPAVKIALQKMEEWSHDPQYSNKEALAVLDPIRAQVERHSEAARDQTLMFKLYSVQMTTENHLAHYDAALEAFDLANQYAGCAPLEEYLELRNKAAVTYSDKLDYENGLAFTEKTLEIENAIPHLKKDLVPMIPDVSGHRGRTLSQKGQFLSSLERFEEAEQAFLAALEDFGNNEIDRNRTASYLLHSYIEAGWKEKYEAAAAWYFGSEDRTTQLSLLLRDPDRKPVQATTFALFVYVKALCRFYLQETNDSACRQIVNAIKEQHFENQHPMELIYKYCAVLAKKTGDKGQAMFYLDQAERCAGSDSGLLKRIVEQGRREYERFEGGRELFSAEDKLRYMYR